MVAGNGIMRNTEKAGQTEIKANINPRENRRWEGKGGEGKERAHATVDVQLSMC